MLPSRLSPECQHDDDRQAERHQRDAVADAVDHCNSLDVRLQRIAKRQRDHSTSRRREGLRPATDGGRIPISMLVNLLSPSFHFSSLHRSMQQRWMSCCRVDVRKFATKSHTGNKRMNLDTPIWQTFARWQKNRAYQFSAESWISDIHLKVKYSAIYFAITL